MPDNIDSYLFLLNATFWVALGFPVATSVLGSVRRFARRGYSTRAICKVLLLVALIVVNLSLAIGPLTVFDLPAVVFVAPLGVLGLRILSTTLPVRAASGASRRISEWPLHWLYYAGAASLLAVGLTMFVLAQPVEGAGFTTVVIMLPWAGLLALRGRRVQRQLQHPRPLNTAMTADARRPVLYLREFSQEQEPFTVADPFAMGALQRLRLRRDLSGLETLEDFFCSAIEQRLGPLVALGSPEDYLQPLGAAREYLDDANWQVRFESLVTEARAILVQAGRSTQLTWELAFVLRSGNADKLFVAVGPSTFATSFLSNLHGRSKGRQWRPRWVDFHRRLAQAGYQLSSRFSTTSGVIKFDRQGSGTFIHCEFEPEAYVLAIEDHLSNGRAT